ncbi:hypothetical protein [Hafnia sp.]|uniref:hypothetical protein n=1 Tax=Hafnia sp. TaxID=1873498 RepID=UPI002FC953D6
MDLLKYLMFKTLLSIGMVILTFVSYFMKKPIYEGIFRQHARHISGRDFTGIGELGSCLLFSILIFIICYLPTRVVAAISTGITLFLALNNFNVEHPIREYSQIILFLFMLSLTYFLSSQDKYIRKAI